MAQSDWAVLVGINRYPELGVLGGPENDAADLHAWLTSAGAVPVKQSTLILSSQFPEAGSALDAQPAVEAVHKALLRLDVVADANSKQGVGRKVGRRLYLYLAGHGCEPVPSVAALLTANATRMWAGHHVPGKLWAEWFKRAGYFDEVLLFMDCCRDSYPQAPLNVPPVIGITDYDAIGQGGHWFYGFATRSTRQSRERTFNGTIHGVFTQTLLSGLRGAAANEHGDVTALSLGSYLYNNMKLFLPAADRDNPDVAKEPDLDFNRITGGQFLIVRVPAPEFEVTVQLPPTATGKTVRILGEGIRVVVSAKAKPPTWVVRLKRGMYGVEIVGSEAPPTPFEVSGNGGVDVTV